MHGKLVLSHSRSTFFLVKRLSINSLCRRRARRRWLRKGRRPDRPRSLLLREGKVRLASAGDVHRFRLWLHAFMPGDDVVLAVGNVLDLVVPAGVSLRKVGRRADNDVARHLRMNVAKQRHYAGVVELEGTLLALRPGAKIVSKFFVATDRWPEDVVLYVVAVQELDRCPNLNDHNVRVEHQALLVHDGLLRWRRERFALNGIHVHDGFSGRHFSLDCAGGSTGYHGGDQQKRK